MAYFIQDNVFMVHPCCSTNQYFSLFHGQVIFHCRNISHFVYSLINWWHLGYFCLLTIVNNAAINICIQVVIWTYVFISLGYIPKSGIAGSYANSIFNHLEPPECFPKQLYNFIFTQATYMGSYFSTSSPTLVIICLFNYSHPNVCEVVSHCGFWWLMMLSISSCAY